MGTRLQTYINSGFVKQGFVGGLHGSESIDFGMALTAAHVVALANDAALCHDNGAHHGVGLGVLASATSQLQATAHVHLVYLLLFHLHEYLVLYLQR